MDRKAEQMTDLVVPGLKSSMSVLTYGARKLRERGFAKRLIKVASKRDGLELSRRQRGVVARWIKSDDGVALIAGCSEVLATTSLASFLTGEGLDVEALGDLTDFVGLLCDELLRFLPTSQQPLALQRTLRTGISRLERLGDDADLTPLPGDVQAFLTIRPPSDRVAVGSLVDALVPNRTPDPEAAKRVASSSRLTAEWRWWQWASVGLHASSYGRSDDASAAFRTALALGAPDAEQWLIRIAISGASDFTAVDLADVPPCPLREVLSILASDRPGDINGLVCPPAHPSDVHVVLHRNLYTLALLLSRDSTLAAKVADETSRQAPWSAMAKLRAAQAHWAAATESGQDRVRHLDQAVARALEVRDFARLRHLPVAADAVAVACRAALLLEQFDLAIEIGCAPPDGRLQDGEDGHPDTVHAVIQAGLLTDRRDIVERALPLLPASHAPSLVRAHIADLDGRTDEVGRLVKDAWNEVSEWGPAVGTLMAWARHLDDPLPSLVEKGFDARDAEQHAQVAEMFRLFHRNEQGAVAAMRALTGSDAHLGRSIIDLYLAMGDRAAALATAERIAELTGDPGVHEFIAIQRLNSDPPALEQAERNAIAFLDGASGTQLELRARRLLAAILHRQGNRRQSLFTHLEWLADARDPDGVWMLAGSMLDSGRAAEAAALLDSSHADPRDQADVFVHLRALHAVGRHVDATRAALEAMDRWDEDNDFCAAVLAFAHSTSGPSLQDEQVGLALRNATEAFLNRAPHHPGFHAVPGDFDSLIETLIGQLKPRREMITVLRWLSRSGRYPLGLVAHSTGISYSELTLDRGMFSRSHNPTEDGHNVERQIALSALDGEIIADLSAVSTSVRAELWGVVRGAFVSVDLTSAALTDALRSVELAKLGSRTSVSTDPHGNLVPREISASEQADRIDLHEALSKVAAQCRCISYSQPAVLPVDWVGSGFDPWVSSIELGHSTGKAVLIDDYSTRVLAASLGVSCFGLYALIDALVLKGKLDQELAETFRSRMLRLGSVGLPAAEERVTRAMSGGASGGPSTEIGLLLANGAVWSDPRQAHGVLQEVISKDLSGGDLQAAADALALALIGVAEHAMHSNGDPIRAAAVVAAVSVAAHSHRPEKPTAQFVGAFDWFLAEWLAYTDGSVEAIAAALYEILVDAGVPPDAAATETMRVLRHLDDSQRRLAAGVVLGDSPPRRSSAVIDQIKIHLHGRTA
jgi:tetratricopeptide (TPR) repeat protein